MTLRSSAACFTVLVAYASAYAQPSSNIDVPAAMSLAGRQHPAAEEAKANVSASEARIDVERAKYWPETHVFGELDRSTANAVAGALFPVPALPVVGGQPGRTFGIGENGTAVGLTASWDALGYRKWDALIEQARAELRATRLDADVRDLDLAYAAADRLIAVVEHDQAVKAAQAGVDRAQVFVTIVKAAVDQKLRPGADLSRAEAELSIAKTAVIRAETAVQVARTQLAVALGQPDAALDVEPGALLRLPARPAAIASRRDDARIAAANARVAATQARERVVETGTLPKIALSGALWARGVGSDSSGLDTHGLVPDVPNWALGIVVTWPVFAGKTVGAQARVEQALVARDQARARVVTQGVAADVARGRAIVDGAYRVAENTPAALKAARDAEQQANARYQAKLATADDVAQAQRLLEQAEIDDAIARLEVWRAILLASYAAGDLATFLDIYRGAGG